MKHLLQANKDELFISEYCTLEIKGMEMRDSCDWVYVSRRVRVSEYILCIEKPSVAHPSSNNW